jgi:hypothetical protein
VCDYTPTVEVGFHNPEERAGIAGRARARLTEDGLSGYATRSYCSHAHRDLGDHGALRASGQLTRELAAYPSLADGQAAP